MLGNRGHSGQPSIWDRKRSREGCVCVCLIVMMENSIVALPSILIDSWLHWGEAGVLTLCPNLRVLVWGGVCVGVCVFTYVSLHATWSALEGQGVLQSSNQSVNTVLTPHRDFIFFPFISSVPKYSLLNFKLLHFNLKTLLNVFNSCCCVHL